VTENQIQYTRKNPVTPRKKRSGQKPVLRTLQRQQIERWLQESPSRRGIPWRHLPRLIPGCEGIGEKAMHTCLDNLGYYRCSSIKKEFSSEPQYLRTHLEFVRMAIEWTEEQMFNIVFSDEV
jgi:hypothetical protein